MSGNSSFKIAHQINDFRTKCFETSSPDYSSLKIQEGVSRIKSTSAWIGHKVFTIISFSSNLIAAGVAQIGMFGSFVLAAYKILVYILSSHECTFPTGYVFFRKERNYAFYQIFTSVKEIFIGYLYRTSIVFEKVFYPNETLRPNFESPFDFVNNLNQNREKLRDDRTLSNLIKHKIISIINIPANILTSAISAADILIGATLIATKVFLYIFTGIELKFASGCLPSCFSLVYAQYHLFRNIGEVGKDSLLFIVDITRLIDLKGIVARAKEVADNAYAAFRHALVGTVEN